MKIAKPVKPVPSDDSYDRYEEERSNEEVVAYMQGPQAEKPLTIEEFRAGYAPNDDDFAEFFGPVSDLAQNALIVVDAQWRADQMIEKGKDIPAAKVDGVRYTFFMMGAVWMMKYMDTVAGTSAVDIEEFAVSDLSVDGPEEPPE
jgi:hypothetical protein